MVLYDTVPAKRVIKLISINIDGFKFYAFSALGQLNIMSACDNMASIPDIVKAEVRNWIQRNNIEEISNGQN